MCQNFVDYSPCYESTVDEGCSIVISRTTSFGSVDPYYKKMVANKVLEDLKKEAKIELEQSWKEAEALKKAFFAKMKTMIRLQSKIEACKRRKCALMEKLAWINVTKKARNVPSNQDAASGSFFLSEGHTYSNESPKTSILALKLATLKLFLPKAFFSCKRNSRIVAENLLKISSRDQTIIGLKSALQESRETIRRLREKRWSIVRQRSSSSSIGSIEMQ